MAFEEGGHIKGEQCIVLLQSNLQLSFLTLCTKENLQLQAKKKIILK